MNDTCSILDDKPQHQPRYFIKYAFSYISNFACKLLSLFVNNETKDYLEWCKVWSQHI